MLGYLARLGDDEPRSTLQTAPGIGPRTADIYLLMALRQPDGWPEGNLALARAPHKIKRRRRPLTEERLCRIARTWLPGPAVAGRTRSFRGRPDCVDWQKPSIADEFLNFYVDPFEPMLARARGLDPQGDYRLVPDGDLRALADHTYDVMPSVFTFDNTPTLDRKVSILRSLRCLLKGNGCSVHVVSSPETYANEWASFSTNVFPGNRTARSGDGVCVVTLNLHDRRPARDIIWSDERYHGVFRRAGLVAIRTCRPWAKPTDPCACVSETMIAPAGHLPAGARATGVTRALPGPMTRASSRTPRGSCAGSAAHRIPNTHSTAESLPIRRGRSADTSSAA